MAQIPQSVKGTQDLFGQKALLYKKIEDISIQIAHSFGFQYINLPILEHTELFLRSIGEGTDVVSKELFNWEDKAGRNLCLRPEGTAQTVRFLLEQGLTRETLKRYFYMGAMFRAEKPQKGRQRQFHQIGIEIFGEHSPSADIDSIHFAVSLLQKLGVNESILSINSLGCKECQPLYIKELKDFLQKKASSFCKLCQERSLSNPLRVLDCKNPLCQESLKEAPCMLDFLCSSCSQHFEGLKKGLISREIPFNIEKNLVRGLDYYTKTVFEITLPSLLGSQDAICGGGRYDDLVENLSGKEKMPAVGLALGVERMMIALQTLNKKDFLEESRLEIVVLSQGFQTKELFSLLEYLREGGYSVLLDSEDRPLGKKLSKADKLGVQWVLIIGEQELEKGIVLLKEMKTSKQREMDLLELKNYFPTKK